MTRAPYVVLGMAQVFVEYCISTVPVQLRRRMKKHGLIVDFSDWPQSISITETSETSKPAQSTNLNTEDTRKLSRNPSSSSITQEPAQPQTAKLKKAGRNVIKLLRSKKKHISRWKRAQIFLLTYMKTTKVKFYIRLPFLVLSDTWLCYYMLSFIFSIMGLCVTPFFFAFNLYDIPAKNRLLQKVIQSVTVNRTVLSLTGFFGVIVIFQVCNLIC